MKVLLKKITVLAAAFAMLFAISACKDPNGAANPDKKGTEPATTTDTTTTTTTDTTTTTTTDTTTTDPSNNNGQNGGGQGTQSHAVLHEYEDLGTSITTLFILEGNAWVMEMNMFGSSMIMARGTYTGNLSADGEVVFTKTKEADPNTGNLIDCEPETQTLTIKDGIIDFYDEEDGEHTYYVRKARVAVNYVTIDVREQIFIEYKFYNNDTFRLYSDGKLIFLGDYDGDPSVNGNISLTPKYKFENGVLSEQTGDVQTITINDSSFTGANGKSAYKEVAVFKAEEDDRDPTLVKFYSNNKFLVASLDLLYNFEVPLYFGECDAIPDSTVEGSQTINFYTTYRLNDNNEWVKIDDDDEEYIAGSLTIENNQFELMNLTFIRQ